MTTPSNPTVVLLVDGDRTIAMADDPLARLLGYDAADLVGQPIEVIAPEGFPSVLDDAGSTRQVLSLRRADGSRVGADVEVRALHGEQSPRYVVLIRDTTRRNGSGSDLSTIAHDLRTPLTAIRGFADVLQKASDRISDEQRADYLTRIGAAASRLDELISEIPGAAQP